MKHSAMWPFFVLSLSIVALTGCNREKGAQTSTAAATQTIAPASAPAAANGTDAMTQTVDVEDSRSEAEGGTLSNNGATPPAGDGAATTAAPAPKPKAKPKAPAKKKS